MDKDLVVGFIKSPPTIKRGDLDCKTVSKIGKAGGRRAVKRGCGHLDNS